MISAKSGQECLKRSVFMSERRKEAQEEEKRRAYHKNKASRLRRRISNNLLYSVYAKIHEKRPLFMPIINGLAL
jgi:hypothetical protein